MLFTVCISGCKKKVFSPLIFSGRVVNYYTSGVAENCIVVLYKHNNTLLATAGIAKNPKEIGRATTDSDGNFSMKLKWLDKRDTYYVDILHNNASLRVNSSNDTFTNYKALESSVEFIVYYQ